MEDGTQSTIHLPTRRAFAHRGAAAHFAVAGGAEGAECQRRSHQIVPNRGLNFFWRVTRRHRSQVFTTVCSKHRGVGLNKAAQGGTRRHKAKIFFIGTRLGAVFMAVEVWAAGHGAPPHPRGINISTAGRGAPVVSEYLALGTP